MTYVYAFGVTRAARKRDIAIAIVFVNLERTLRPGARLGRVIFLNQDQVAG